MTRFEALVSLNLTGEVGAIRLQKLLQVFGKPENIFSAPEEKLSAVFGIGSKIAQAIRVFKPKALEKELLLAKKLNLRILTLEDIDYSENLKNIPDAAIVLYVKGVLQKEDAKAVGIVGSRRASFYGLTAAEKFAAELSENGFTVVSGLARGIDAAAHRGALKAGGRTIAVMGSGFNQLYPPENMELAEEISQSGAVISEFPINTEPLPHNFPRRNRIISGLSMGVLVVEAAQNSGALITADFALEQGREVFALPGKIDSGNSFGTNELIKQGAKLVCSVEDILEEFNLTQINTDKEPQMSTDENLRLSALKKGESVLYNLISSEPVTLDELLEKTKLNVTQASEELLTLQLRKLIKQLPGKQFIRSTHAS